MENRDPIWLCFYGTTTRAARAPTQGAARRIVMDQYLQERSIRLRKSEVRARRATADDIGWLTDAGEYLLATAIAKSLQSDRTTR